MQAKCALICLIHLLLVSCGSWCFSLSSHYLSVLEEVNTMVQGKEWLRHPPEEFWLCISGHVTSGKLPNPFQSKSSYPLK